MIRYDMKDDFSFRLGPGGGRPGKETGAVSLVWGDSPSSRGEGKTMTPDEATALVLEQVQRTFLHLRDGERRFFDPIRFVEACRCLNLEYLVHQQNDASEFCDKLLDRIESGMKAGQLAVAAAAGSGGGGGGGGVAGVGAGGGGGTGGKPRVAALERLFGGTWVHQKIPTGCAHRTNRSEPFINLEVNIRGKESLEESLASFVESELMAGDNKVRFLLFFVFFGGFCVLARAVFMDRLIVLAFTCVCFLLESLIVSPINPPPTHRQPLASIYDTYIRTSHMLCFAHETVFFSISYPGIAKTIHALYFSGTKF